MDYSSRLRTIENIVNKSDEEKEKAKNEYMNAQSSLSHVQNVTNTLYDDMVSSKNKILKLVDEIKYNYLYEVPFDKNFRFECQDERKVVEEIDWLNFHFVPDLKKCIDREKNEIE
jgi:hypothetical protein